MATFSSIFGIKSSHTSKHHPHVLQSASSSTSSMAPLTAPTSNNDDKNFTILKELASLNSNRNCFDCLQRGPTYVNMTIGSFICTSCSGKLRGLNPPHRVKSISMAVFSDEEIDFLKSRGNDFCQKVWLGKYPGPLLPLEKENDSKLMDILTARYERKCWYISPTDPMYDEARRRTECELNRKNKTTISHCKTTQTDMNSSKLMMQQQQQQHINHNSTPQMSNSQNSKHPPSSSSSSFARSPLKTFSPVTPKSLPPADSPKFSFQPVTEFADFTKFSSPMFTPSQTFPFTSTPQQTTPGYPHIQGYPNVPHPHNYAHMPSTNLQDKYAPFHELTADMESLSINWNGSRFQADFSFQNSAWKNGEQFMSESSESLQGRNPFTGISPPINQSQPPPNQFHMTAQDQCFHYPGFIQAFPPTTNPFAVPPLGMNQPLYEGMLYHPAVPGNMTHRYSRQSSPQTSLVYQSPYYYQGFLQYNPSNPFLNQPTENKNTNPFL